MSAKTSRLALMLSVAGCIGLLIGLLSIQKTATKIEAFTPDSNALQKYRYVSSLRMGDRKKYFSNATAREKSDLIRTHLFEYLKSHSELNANQRAVIWEGINLATPELYETARRNGELSAKADAQLQALKNHALAVFMGQQAQEIFATLGDRRISSVEAGIPAPILPDCECSKISNYCNGNGSHPCSTSIACEHSSWGCGTLWGYDCVGMCL